MADLPSLSLQTAKGKKVDDFENGEKDKRNLR